MTSKMSRGLVLAGVVGALGFGPSMHAAHAQSLLGNWEVRHSDLGHIYQFRPDGTYAYVRYGVPLGGSPRALGAETGHYSIQGNLLGLTPTHGTPKTCRWRIGPEVTAAYVLYLACPGSPEDFFYPGSSTLNVL